MYDFLHPRGALPCDPHLLSFSSLSTLLPSITSFYDVVINLFSFEHFYCHFNGILEEQEDECVHSVYCLVTGVFGQLLLRGCLKKKGNLANFESDFIFTNVFILKNNESINVISVFKGWRLIILH